VEGKNFCGALVTSCCILLVQNNYLDAHWLGPHMITFFLHIGKDKVVLIFTKEQRGVNF
jgi:hypothetical protein